MSSSTPPIPFKSKKPLQSTPKSKSTDSIATQTPDKPPETLPPRLRNLHVALSLKEVRKVAQGNRDGLVRNQTDLVVKSARRQILSWAEDSTSGARKPKNASTADETTKLPANYELLAEFFDCLVTSFRSKGSMSTFTYISSRIEHLSDRRFSHQHLAQLKYIMPEMIEIKSGNMYDERTRCTKPDLHISINVDDIEFDGNLKSLGKVFRSRLADFYKSHPQGDEIPEEVLPAAASHLSGSFRRHLSLKRTPIEPLTPSPHPQKRCYMSPDNAPTISIIETERKTQEERDPAISQAKRRRQMIARLPKLFDTIHFFIQSINRSVITKQELMHKIITSLVHVVDIKEVEEQLNLLLELAPEWISQKFISSGDLLIRINKISSAVTIRTRLEEAK